MNENFNIFDSIYKIEEEDLIVKESESLSEEVSSQYESEYLEIKADFVIMKSEDVLEKEISLRIKSSSLYLPTLLGVCNYSSLGNGLVLERVRGKALDTAMSNKHTSLEEKLEIIYSLISMFDFCNTRNLFFKNLILKDLIFDKKSEKLYLCKCPINHNEEDYSNKQIMNLPPELFTFHGYITQKTKSNFTDSESPSKLNCNKINDLSFEAEVDENWNSWMLGLLIAEILEGHHLFFTGYESRSEILKMLSAMDGNFIISKINSLPYNQYIKNILKKLLKVDPKQRSNSKLIKQKFNSNLILANSKNLKTNGKEDFNDTAFLIKNEASLMDLSRDLNFNVTINNDTVYNNKRKYSEEINIDINSKLFFKNLNNIDDINQENIHEDDINTNYNNTQTGVTTTSIKLEKKDEAKSNFIDDDKLTVLMSPILQQEMKEELPELMEIFEKKEQIEENLIIKIENEENSLLAKQESRFIEVNETNNENLIEQIDLKEIADDEKEKIPIEKCISSTGDIMELNKIFSKPDKTVTDRLEELANDYQITNSERYLEEIEDILNISSENIRAESKLDTISKTLWETFMLLAFKHLENDDLKSHYLVSSLLYTTVEKVFGKDPLKIGLAKFHYAKCMKDYSCNYSLSLNLFLESLNLLEKANEAESKVGIQVKFFLGNLYTDMGMCEESIATLRDVLRKQIELFTEEHSFTARTYNCLGIAEDNRCNYRQAREYYEKSYTIFKLLSYGLETIDCAKVLNNLAGIYFRWDDFTSAIKFYLKVLEVYLNKYGESCAYIGVTYYNLGNCYLMINNDEKSMDYLKKAKEIFTKELGATHPQTAMSCKNLGDLYYNMNDQKNALELYTQCINTFLEKYGEDHDLYVTTLSKLKKLKSLLK